MRYGDPTPQHVEQRRLARPDLIVAGREWDGDAGLYYNRARWYDAGTGRFISEDPLGLGGGDANRYRYAAGDPVNFRDPSGLFFDKIIREIKRAYKDVEDFADRTGHDIDDFVNKDLGGWDNVAIATALIVSGAALWAYGYPVYFGISGTESGISLIAGGGYSLGEGSSEGSDRPIAAGGGGEV